MKKIKFLSLIMALALTLPAAALPAAAETDPTQTTAVETLPAETVPVPTSPLPVIPVSGDASVSAGSHSINGKVPMASAVEYTPKAKGAFLYDINSDTVLYSYNPDEKLYPASLTKVMTCMVALDLITDLNEVVTVPEEVIARVDPSGSSMDLIAGEEIPMIEMLYGLMVESANDAAMVIADHLAGSEEAFVVKMNEKAAEIGCDQTHYMNVHGLHDEEHYTTPRDMAKILLAATQNETFRELYSTSTHECPATNLSETRYMVTTNYLISEAVLQAYYDSRVIGGKTGFTTPAGRCLATVSEVESTGMKLLCVVMGTQMEYAEDGYTVLNYGSFEQTQALLDFGYGNYMSTEVLSDAQSLGQFPVAEGDADAQGRVHGNSHAVLPVGSDINSIRYEYVLDDGVMTAPLEADASIGVVRVWYQTKCIAQQELYAAGSVRKAVPMAQIPDVNPAAPVQTGMDIWQIVLIAILVLLVAIFLLLAAGRIRAARERARRKKRRAAARRRAAQQSRRPSAGRQAPRRQNPGTEQRRRR